MKNIILGAVIAFGFYAFAYSIYLAFNDPMLTQTQIFLKLVWQ